MKKKNIPLYQLPKAIQDNLKEFGEWLGKLAEHGDAAMTLDDKEAKTLAISLGITAENIRREGHYAAIVFSSDTVWFYAVSYWYDHDLPSDNGWAAFKMKRTIYDSFSQEYRKMFYLALLWIWGFDAPTMLPNIKELRFNQNQ